MGTDVTYSVSLSSENVCRPASTSCYMLCGGTMSGSACGALNAQPLQSHLKVSRQRSLHHQRLPGPRVRDAHPRGVQELSRRK